MAKDINQILDDAVVPEMEYDPHEKKRSTAAATIDDVPEFELPKTKAEVYREAKDRLSEKTAAVSPAYKKSGRSKKRAASKDETAAADNTVAAQPSAEPVWVGDADELIPFAWRHPLIPDLRKPSKYYKRTVRDAIGGNVPALRESKK